MGMVFIFREGGYMGAYIFQNYSKCTLTGCVVCKFYFNKVDVKNMNDAVVFFFRCETAACHSVRCWALSGFGGEFLCGCRNNLQHCVFQVRI